MAADTRGILRGRCNNCECDQFFSSDGTRCEYCDHPAGRHQNLSSTAIVPPRSAVVADGVEEDDSLDNSDSHQFDVEQTSLTAYSTVRDQSLYGMSYSIGTVELHRRHCAPPPPPPPPPPLIRLFGIVCVSCIFEEELLRRVACHPYVVQITFEEVFLNPYECTLTLHRYIQIIDNTSRTLYAFYRFDYTLTFEYVEY